MSASDFEALMLQADTRTAGPEQAMRFSGEHMPSAGSAGSGSGDGTAREPQPEPPEPPEPPMTHDPDVPDRRPDHVLRSVGEQARTVARAVVEGVHAIGASDNPRAAAIGPEIPAAHERVDADVTDRPDAGRPESPVAETDPVPERPIPATAPEQLRSPFDAPATETGPRDQAQTPQPQADPASTASTGGGAVAPAPAAASGTALAIARQAPPRTLESGSPGGARDAVSAPAVPAGVSAASPSGATGPSEERRTPSAGDELARAVEPQRALAPTDGADGADQRLLQEKPAARDAPSGSQVRGADPSATQQPSSEVQPGRLPPTSGLHGSVVAGAHPAAAVTGEIAQVATRAPDGAVSVEQPATHQVALHITKALDQDRTEIRIRLDPPDLGEVDIQLEFRDLRLTASVSADRPDTLDLLQRDSRSLVRALREAGLELADSDLSFAHNGRDDRPDGGSYAQRAINLPHPFPSAAPLQDPSRALAGRDGFVSLSDGRMDLRV